MKPTADDFIRLTAEIQMDLRSAQAKMVQLRSWIANLDLPTDEQPVDEAKLAIFVANTRHEYTDYSLRDELARKGADDDMIERLLAGLPAPPPPPRDEVGLRRRFNTMIDELEKPD